MSLALFNQFLSFNLLHVPLKSGFCSPQIPWGNEYYKVKNNTYRIQHCVGFQIILSTILAIQNNNHTQKHKYLRGKPFLLEGKKHGTNSKQFHCYQINYNNSCVCFRLNKNLSYFSLFSHTQIISLKGGNTLLSHFYFLLPTQLSLGCLLLSKRLTFGCSLFFLVWLPLSLLLRTLFVSFQRRQPLTLSFLLCSSQMKIHFILY